MLMGPDASPEAVAALATKLGLDQPALQRYGDWIGGLLVGNMGESYAYSTPVLDLVLERLALTIPLALLAMLITAVLALLAGVYAASRHNRWGDVGVMALAQIGIAIPNFWFAILLILLFSVKLQWFSAGGFPGWTQASGGSPLEALKALLLPAIALAVVQAAILARITRSAVLEVLREDFVRTARAKGLSQRAALWVHVLRNAMVPMVQYIPQSILLTVGGSLLMERFFSVPGMGPLLTDAIQRYDLNVVQTLVILYAVLGIVGVFMGDVLMMLVDPRITLTGKEAAR